MNFLLMRGLVIKSLLIRVDLLWPASRLKCYLITTSSDLLAFASRTRNPTRNEVIVLLSAKAGLRAGEIANLTWDMVLNLRGHVGFVLDLRHSAAKKGSGRIVPVHADLRRALIAWLEISNELWACHPVRAWRPHDCAQHCSLVQQGFSNHWVEGMLVPLWPTNLHYARRKARPPQQVGRCATSSYWPGTGRFRLRSATSTATLMCSASWCP